VIDVAYARGQNVHVSIAVLEHFLDVLNNIHAVFTLIVEPADKRRYIYRLL